MKSLWLLGSGGENDADIFRCWRGKCYQNFENFYMGQRMLGEIEGGFLWAVTIIAFLSAFIGWELGKKISTKWSVPMGVLSMVISVLIGAIYVLFMFTLPKVGISKFLKLASEDLLGMFTFHLESGLECGFIGFFLAPATFIYSFIKARKENNNSSSLEETTYSEEKDDLEPEWVNSRDDLEPELENNEETQEIDIEPAGAIYSKKKDAPPPKLVGNKEPLTIDAEPDKSIHPWNKKLLIGWGVLSILWVTSMGNILTDFDENIYDLETVILNVEIGSPRVKKYEDSAYKSKKLDFSGLHWFSIKRLKPDSTELSKAKNKFPHLKGMTNSEFSDHLWGLVQREAIENLAQRKESFESRRLSNYISSVVIPPTAVFILGSIIVWGLRKYPPRAWNLRKYLPSELTPYTKKVIATSAVWVMAAISWFMIEEGGDLGDVFEYEHVLAYILPPLVLIVASVLWNWANKPPASYK